MECINRARFDADRELSPSSFILVRLTHDCGVKISMDSSAPLLVGAPNFRDFGGYPTLDGRRVRTGRLYRTELMLNLTPPDHETLNGLNIGLICDLRSPGERSRVSNEWPKDGSVETLALDIDADLSSVQPDKWGKRLRDPSFSAERAREAMIDNYRQMPSAFAKDLGALFAYLEKDHARAVVIHCAVGKDRTGFVSAMVLHALGVGHEQIMANYALTSERYTPERMMSDRVRFLPNTELTPHVRTALGMLVIADPVYLQAALDTVKKDFGSLDDYLLKHCDLSPQRRDAMQSQLLVPN